MPRRFAISAALVAALFALAASQDPKPKTDPGAKKEPKADPTDAALAAALRNDPDVRVAQAKMQLAEAELAKAKQGTVLQLESALANPGFWTGQLSLLDYRGVPLDALAGAMAPYQSITPDDVRACFARYDVPDKRIRLVLVQKAEAKTVKPLEREGPPAPEAIKK